jgi:heme-degrading monooxygenase HmoA
MKCRIWKTGVVVGRFEEYERFARDISLPMFRSQDGFQGVVMAGDGAERLVITLWRDETAIAALDSSPAYKETVARIVAAGFLTGDQSVDVHDVHLADLARSTEIQTALNRGS